MKPSLDSLLDGLLSELNSGSEMESSSSSASSTMAAAQTACVIQRVKALKKRKREEDAQTDETNDDQLFKYAQFNDFMALEMLGSFLKYVPRLVNVVTVRLFTREKNWGNWARREEEDEFGCQLLILGSRLSVVATAGRSLSGEGVKRDPSLESLVYRQQMRWIVLCATTLCGRAVCIYESQS